ncbi:MAG TPA: hypothetical protein VLQ93_15375, partial [Myxococcaceae bacterium]|nr:hypothetical protein [Myxococcaceae bacterium]
MNIPCPSCHQHVTPGDHFCATCGLSLLVEARPNEPACAVHPQLRSIHVCDRCGAFACARCLHANALGEVHCARCHEREPSALLPWDRREELGLLKAFWKTCVEIMLRPGVTFSSARAEGTTGSALLFVTLCSIAGYLTTALIYAALFAFTPLGTPPDTGGAGPSPEQMRLIIVGGTLGWLLLAPAFAVIATLISSGMDHLVLRMAGVSQGFQVTLRGNALSQAPLLTGLIPLCSLYVAPFWVLVVRVFAYRGLHRTTWGTATVGALAAPLLSCVLCGGGYVALLAFAISQATAG